MRSHRKVNDDKIKRNYVTLAIANTCFILAGILSFRTVNNGSLDMLFFIPFYLIMFITFGITGTKIISDISMKKPNPKLIRYSFVFTVSSFFVVGDGNDGGYVFWQGKKYTTGGSTTDLPHLIKAFEEISTIVFFVTGIICIVYMFKFAFSDTYD